MDVIRIISAYIIVVNILAFASMGIDKLKAKRGSFRISEATLFLLAIIGGSPGSIIGMYLFRHKTAHWYFVIGMPIILILQIAGVFFLTHSFFSFRIL